MYLLREVRQKYVFSRKCKIRLFIVFFIRDNVFNLPHTTYYKLSLNYKCHVYQITLDRSNGPKSRMSRCSKPSVLQ